MDIYKNGCPFCNEFNGKPELSFFKYEYGDQYNVNNRIVFQTPHFACVPPLGSFCEGYLLIVPKEHCLSMLSLQDSILDEFIDIIRRIEVFYDKQYHKKLITFEHGTSIELDHGGMSVVHAHVHCVPCFDNINDKEMCSYGFEFQSFHNFIELKTYWDHKKHTQPYLYYSDINRRQYIYEGSDIPSQIFRRILCNHIRNDDTWNWKQYPYIENIKKTLIDTCQYTF